MDQFEKLQEYFQILGDARRLRIINFIGKQERTVSEIINETGLSQPLVSHHLKVLKNNQIVVTKREGAFILYKLKDIKFLNILGVLTEILLKEDLKDTDKPVFSAPACWKNTCGK